MKIIQNDEQSATSDRQQRHLYQNRPKYITLSSMPEARSHLTRLATLLNTLEDSLLILRYPLPEFLGEIGDQSSFVYS